MKIICIYSEEFPPETNYGGISTYNRNLSDLLAQSDYNVVIITKSLGRDYIVNDGKVTIYRVKPFYSGFSSIDKLIGFRLASFFKFISLNRKFQFSIVETPEWKAEAFFLFLFHKFIPNCPPLIIRLHGCRAIIREVDEQKISFSDKIVMFMERFVMEQSSYISSISNSCLEKTEKCMNLSLKAKTKVIYNSTDLPEIKHISEYKEDNRYILFVGRIEIWKGVFVLADTISQIFDEISDVNIIFVGRDIIDRESGLLNSHLLLNRIGEKYKDRVFFTGQIDKKELNKIYQEAYCTVLPSMFEPFGLCCIESMKNGTPVIGSKLGGMSEIITDKQDGFLINPKDSFEIKDKLITLLKDKELREKFSKSAIEKIQTKFSNEVIFKQIDDFYNSIIKTN